ncbi:sirohydrochlorin chelatase [Bacillus canaveralius]|uniref:Sirohydrochlorin chelatase n=1 Tax=Bacillus canaveralius TaxID=1403243 RepID=A0A2N5GHY4_9BACI|nr:sirohydrochlorin chelatase [Bacillus canaveralius]PLR80381.1 sirohydrochlorin chelatase [Bacillus canaveralius]PLR88864.1 sirohydrochlorin chelatase [Bacillus canaveralius]
MKAILFVGHGSRDPEGNDQVRQFIDNMSGSWDDSLMVETCFLEFERPTVNQGIDICVEKGASQIFVIPIMLLQAGHSKIHIPAAIDEAKKKYPHVQFTYGRPIGVHEEALEILKTRLTEIGENLDHPEPDTAILLLGRGGSDPDANSDLYKIARLLWEKTNYKIVEPAFMGVTNPLVDEGIERCLKLGAKKVIILPYFLFTGILIKRLEEMMVPFSNQYPHIEFKLAGYFGYHPRLETILKDRVEEALQDDVKMNCDTCLYRLNAMEHVHHHHHHDHDHEHHHHDHEPHHHEDEHEHHHAHVHGGQRAGELK